jgi:hypothetical protein
MLSQFNIVKANGDIERFSERKFRNSLQRAHIPKKYHGDAVRFLEKKMHNNISTQDIHGTIQEYLHQSFPKGECTYNLKQALMNLGPTGYPFERYIAAVLEFMGYETKVSQMVLGKCVSHEVDVIAEKDLSSGRRGKYMIECKFHNQQGMRSDVKTSLYIHARFQDILPKWTREFERVYTIQKDTKLQSFQAWLITNTKCTTDAIQYAECAGMKVISWEYPEKGNLQKMVEQAGVYPVTALCNLSFAQQRSLLDRGVVLVRDLLNDPEILYELGVSKDAAMEAIGEAEYLARGEFE